MTDATSRSAIEERDGTINQKSQVAIKELVTLFDHLLEEHGFGWDHWHSILWNLHNVGPEEWTQLPQGGGRTIRELVVHLGVTFLMYESHAFGDGSREWNDGSIDGVLPGDSPDDLKKWIRLAHKRLRDSIALLMDDDLATPRKAPWGDEYETRRIIELQIQHTLYHVGEINHLRALLQRNDDWDHQDMGREPHIAKGRAE
jgi:uncharacterized damage-inducible protein DinB